MESIQGCSLPAQAVRHEEGDSQRWAVATVEGAGSRGGLVWVRPQPASLPTILSQAFLKLRVAMGDKAHRDRVQYRLRKLLLASDFFHSVWMARDCCWLPGFRALKPRGFEMDQDPLRSCRQWLGHDGWRGLHLGQLSELRKRVSCIFPRQQTEGDGGRRKMEQVGAGLGCASLWVSTPVWKLCSPLQPLVESANGI